jgi:hypothetical protein
MLVAIGIVIVVLLFYVVALSLCKAAGRADEQFDDDDFPRHTPGGWRT